MSGIRLMRRGSNEECRRINLAALSLEKSGMKVLIADDHDVYRAGLALLLRSQGAIEEVVEAAGFDDALDRLAEQAFAMAFFDLDMPGMVGAKTLARVRSVYSSTRFAIISAEENPAIIREMLDAGAEFYLPKSLSFKEMASRINEALSLCAETAASFSTRSRPNKLTPRQNDVLKGIARGMTNKEIARDLGIAPGTVKIHLSALFDHFDVSNRTELLARSSRTVG